MPNTNQASNEPTLVGSYTHQSPPTIFSNQDNQPIHSVGTILAWRVESIMVANYLTNKNLIKRPFMKIVSFKANSNITDEVLWLGQAEADSSGYRIDKEFNNYARLATEREIEEFDNAYLKLNIITERPLPGQVVKFLGNDRNLKGKRAVVTSQQREDIYIEFLTSINMGLVIRSKANILGYTNNQDGGFEYEPNSYCSCDTCNAVRPLSGITPNGYNLGLVRIDSKYFCDNICAHQGGYYRCQNCNNYVNELLTQIVGANICRRCIGYQYRACEDCGQIHRIDRMRSLTAGGFICSNCTINNGTIIHSYSYKPTPVFNKMPWENTRYLGIELEVEAPNMDAHVLANRVSEYLKKSTSPTGKPLQKLVYYKSDGSLRNGVEIVFHPFTLKAFHKWFPTNDFIKFLHSNGASADTNCGMHVHVSKEKLSKEHLLRGKWFFYKCERPLKIFSDRGGSFNFCKFEGIPNDKDPYHQPDGRRTALNVAGSPKTLEIRLFRSTLDYSKFMANLQFADAFVDYIQHGPVGIYFRTKSGVQIWENFIDYAKKDSRWQIMVKYLLTKSIV